MPSIEIKEHETFDYALRRFKRQCDRAGVLMEARRREFYEKPTWVRKRKKRTAIRNARRRNRLNSPRHMARQASSAIPILPLK